MKRSYKLLAFGIAALSCGAATPAFADDPVTGSTEFTVTVNPYLNLTLSSADMSAGNIIHLPLTPSSSGTYGSKSLTATASTNNAYGYTLVMSTPHTYLESSTINVNDGTYPHIEAITSRTGGRTAAEFADNTYDDMNKWGISIDNTTSYNPIALSQNLKKVTTPVADSTTVINMATVLDLLTPPGSYSTTMNFELVANAATGSMEQAFIDAGKSKVTVGNNSYYKMQDMTTAICNATVDTTGVMEVVDIRDNTIYHIGKLADNRCWLLDNLALDLTNASVQEVISSDNTNALDESLGYLINGGGDTSDKYAIDPVASNVAIGEHSSPQIRTTYKNQLPGDAISNPNQWKIGVFYNFCAASAGSYCYGNGASAGTSVGDATEDICPYGWRLPTGNTGGELGYSYYNSDDVDALRRMLHLTLSGYIGGANAYMIGTSGDFWTSTRHQDYSMYTQYIVNNSAYPQGQQRYTGYSIRCIAK